MAIKQLSYFYCAHFGVFRVRLSPGFLLLGANERVTLKMPVGGGESTVAIRTRYLSLDFFPVVNAPLLGASQCVCSSTSKTGSPSLKGKIGKEVAETQCGLYHLRTPARHWQLRNTTTYIRCHAALKTNTKNDSRHTIDVQTQQSKWVSRSEKRWHFFPPWKNVT